MANERQRDELIECADRINASLANIFGRIGELNEAVTTIWRSLPTRRPASRDLAALRPLISQHLASGGSALQGTGVILDPGVLQDQEMYAEWWYLTQAGRIAPLSLNFNRNSENYYDYCGMPWFAQPRKTGSSVAIGPYIDLYGQDMYILTFTSPILIDGRFIGIAGADIALNRFERVLMSGLVRLQREALIVSDEGRVVVANTANWAAGEMLRQAFDHREHHCRIVELGRGCAHWSLIERPAPRQLAGAA